MRERDGSWPAGVEPGAWETVSDRTETWLAPGYVGRIRHGKDKEGGQGVPGFDGEQERQHLYRLFFDVHGGLGICGCNQPWEAYDLVRDLLRYFAQDHADRDYRDVNRLIGTDGVVHLVLCLLDNADLIEHGGTVAGAWLTGKGRHALELMGRHEWEDGEDGTPGIGETGYPHDGNDCTDACWIPREPLPPQLSAAARMDRIRELSADQRAAMTPAQRALDDAATDLMLYGEAFIPVGAGTIIGELLNPTPLAEQSGPPWTHTFTQKPPCDLDDCCETDGPCGCNCHRTQPTHTIERLGEVLAKHPDGDEIAGVVTGSLARMAVAYSKALEPALAPRPSQFLQGCHQTDGSWVHGRPHDCPAYLHGVRGRGRR